MDKILFQEKKDCCGCEACANICPTNIITMKQDSEGFYYPKIIGENKCIGCNLCEKVCPIKNVTYKNDFKENAYAGYSNDDDKIKESSSGGLATEISEIFIKNGGIVYGVRYDECFTSAVYDRAYTIDELNNFKTSKYIQSRKNKVYQNIKNDLNDKKNVLFIGLPCDCNALQGFLQKSYDKLYICALICHGVTSPNVHSQYCEMKNVDKKHINFFSVRFKPYGWKPYFIKMVCEDKVYTEQFDKSDYGKAFLYLKRPSCNSCKIKRSAINSDLTIGDFHLSASCKGKVKPYNVNGVSSAIVHTDKGEELISKLINFNISKIPLKEALYSEAYLKAIPKKSNREEFGKVFATEGLQSACQLKSVLKIEKNEKRIRSIKSKCAKIKQLLIKLKDIKDRGL